LCYSEEATARPFEETGITEICYSPTNPIVEKQLAAARLQLRSLLRCKLKVCSQSLNGIAESMFMPVSSKTQKR
jgi:hypothetical protein